MENYCGATITIYKYKQKLALYFNTYEFSMLRNCIKNFFIKCSCSLFDHRRSLGLYVVYIFSRFKHQSFILITNFNKLQINLVYFNKKMLCVIAIALTAVLCRITFINNFQTNQNDNYKFQNLLFLKLLTLEKLTG